MRETRTEKRAAFDDRQRIILLEQDGDVFEASVIGINQKLGKLLWAAVGGLISFSTASILLVVNLVTSM